MLKSAMKRAHNLKRNGKKGKHSMRVGGVIKFCENNKTCHGMITKINLKDWYINIYIVGHPIFKHKSLTAIFL